MNLPKVINDLTRAQNNLDGAAFSECFVEDGVVKDDGITLRGRKEISGWIQRTSEKYQTFLRPLEYKEQADESVLVVEAHGNFKGSPTILKYNFRTQNGLVEYLRITA